MSQRGIRTRCALAAAAGKSRARRPIRPTGPCRRARARLLLLLRRFAGFLWGYAAWDCSLCRRYTRLQPCRRRPRGVHGQCSQMQTDPSGPLAGRRTHDQTGSDPHATLLGRWPIPGAPSQTSSLSLTRICLTPHGTSLRDFLPSPCPCAARCRRALQMPAPAR